MVHYKRQPCSTRRRIQDDVDLALVRLALGWRAALSPSLTTVRTSHVSCLCQVTCAPCVQHFLLTMNLSYSSSTNRAVDSCWPNLSGGRCCTSCVLTCNVSGERYSSSSGTEIRALFALYRLEQGKRGTGM